MSQIPPSTLQLLPDFNDWPLTMSVLILPLTISWWSVWYPGSEPGGGSYIAQRILAAKSEKDALGGTLFFNMAHYALRPWPWILVALASMLVYPQLDDIARAFPYVDRSLIGHDMAYPAMLVFLPSGMLGLMVAACSPPTCRRSPHTSTGARRICARPVSPLHSRRCRREALRDDGPHRHRAADGVRRRHDVPPGNRAHRLRAAAVDRRGIGCLSAALVLVAHQRVERDCRDGGVVRGRDRLLRGRQDGQRVSAQHGVARHRVLPPSRGLA